MADIDELGDDESVDERATFLPLFEVYNPIHSIITGDVIAIAQFDQNATELEHDLASARRTAWAVLAPVFVFTFLALSGIVCSAHLTIERRHRQLVDRIETITRVSRQNHELRSRVQAASQRATALNERFLKRIGAELHDGPAQSLALANLRIGTLRRLAASVGTVKEVRLIHEALKGALTDIRGLSLGLILPELDGPTASEIDIKAA